MFHVAGGILLVILIIMFLPMIEKVLFFILKAIPVLIIALGFLFLLTRS